MFEQTPEQRAELLAKAQEFAGGYVRTFDPAVLQHLYRTVVEKVLPDTATHAEHAACNAERRLVMGFIRQVQLANTGNPETPWQTTTAQPQPPAAEQKAQPRRRTSGT